MFARVKSLSSLAKGASSDKRRRSAWPRFQKHRSSLSSNASCSDSESYTSDVSELQIMKRIESHKHLHKTVSRTRRGWLRFTNRSYERKWRRERRLQTADPIVVNIGTSHFIDVLCNCDRCPCKHDR